MPQPAALTSMTQSAHSSFWSSLAAFAASALAAPTFSSPAVAASMIAAPGPSDAQDKTIRRELGTGLDAGLLDRLSALSREDTHQPPFSGMSASIAQHKWPTTPTFTGPESATAAANTLALTSRVPKPDFSNGFNGLSILRRNEAKLARELAKYASKDGN